MATEHGLVFPDERGRPELLGRDGEVVLLDETTADSVPGFSPAIKADPATGEIAYALTHDGTVTLSLLDLADRSRRSIALPCDSTCAKVQVDAVDSERVFVSTSEGTTMWRADQTSDQLVDFAAKGTRVVDARNKVLIYTGAPPRSLDGWRYVEGRSDDQLTFDGSHVLSWWAELESTDGSPPIVLDQGARKRSDGLTFTSLDSDGSVLVATVVTYPEFDFYDCEIPSGSCQFLRREETGDPVFIGNDL